MPNSQCNNNKPNVKTQNYKKIDNEQSQSIDDPTDDGGGEHDGDC